MNANTTRWPDCIRNIRMTPESKHYQQKAESQSIKWTNRNNLMLDLDKYEEWVKQTFVFNKDLNTLTIHVDYPYEVELDRIRNRIEILQWVEHLAGKSWMTRKAINTFIHRVCEIKDWDLYNNLDGDY